jgi:hypothetical protein
MARPVEPVRDHPSATSINAWLAKIAKSDGSKRTKESLINAFSKAHDVAPSELIADLEYLYRHAQYTNGEAANTLQGIMKWSNKKGYTFTKIKKLVDHVNKIDPGGVPGRSHHILAHTAAQTHDYSGWKLDVAKKKEASRRKAYERETELRNEARAIDKKNTKDSLQAEFTRELQGEQMSARKEDVLSRMIDSAETNATNDYYGREHAVRGGSYDKQMQLQITQEKIGFTKTNDNSFFGDLFDMSGQYFDASKGGPSVFKPIFAAVEFVMRHTGATVGDIIQSGPATGDARLDAFRKIMPAGLINKLLDAIVKPFSDRSSHPSHRSEGDDVLMPNGLLPVMLDAFDLAFHTHKDGAKPGSKEFNDRFEKVFKGLYGKKGEKVPMDMKALGSAMSAGAEKRFVEIAHRQSGVDISDKDGKLDRTKVTNWALSQSDAVMSAIDKGTVVIDKKTGAFADTTANGIIRNNPFFKEHAKSMPEVRALNVKSLQGQRWNGAREMQDRKFTPVEYDPGPKKTYLSAVWDGAKFVWRNKGGIVGAAVDGGMSGEKGVALRNKISAGDSTARDGFVGEQHMLLKLRNGNTGVANYMGPGTHVIDRLHRGDEGRTVEDAVAKRHDIDYFLAADEPTKELQAIKVREADERMIAALKKIQAEGTGTQRNIQAGMKLIQLKTVGEDIGVIGRQKFAGGLVPLSDEDRELLINGIPGDNRHPSTDTVVLSDAEIRENARRKTDKQVTSNSKRVPYHKRPRIDDEYPDHDDNTRSSPSKKRHPPGTVWVPMFPPLPGDPDYNPVPKHEITEDTSHLDTVIHGTLDTPPATPVAAPVGALF